MKRQMRNWIVGATCAIGFLLGMILVLLPEEAQLAAAITVMVVSIASGLILPNPLSLVGLGVGVLILFIPMWIVGLVLAVLGAGGMICNPVMHLHPKT